MAQTLIGVYDNSTDAQQVRDELLRQGFDDDEVTVRYGDGTGTTTDVLRDEDHGGGIMGFFRSLFGSDEDTDYVNRYHEAVSGGRAVVTVSADTDEGVEEAQSIMNRYNPIDVDVQSTRIDEAITSVGMGKAASTVRPVSNTQQERSIPVVEEDLQIGKRVVARGGVRVFSRLEERPVEESIKLREERARVERTQANRPATEADLRAAQQGSIEIRETIEEPVVAKQARVVEEVHIGKDVSERTETVRDKVRHTEVQVEQLDRQGDTDWDKDYRTHWQSNFARSGGTYDDYAPAYRYGATLRVDQRYRGREWAAAEPDIRRDWEAREPGTWEKIKDSVRYGWDRMKS
jgi:stress response protein YsnF